MSIVCSMLQKEEKERINILNFEIVQSKQMANIRLFNFFFVVIIKKMCSNLIKKSKIFDTLVGFSLFLTVVFLSSTQTPPVLLLPPRQKNFSAL